MFRSAIGDTEGCIRALVRAVEIKPDYAPAVLALGSVEYQRERKEEGRKLLFSLLSMLDDASDGVQIIDTAGDFLIERGEYAFGIGLIKGLQKIVVASNRPELSPAAMFIGVLFSGLVGVLAGLYPAVRASRLSPVEALRTD